MFRISRFVRCDVGQPVAAAAAADAAGVVTKRRARARKAAPKPKGYVTAYSVFLKEKFHGPELAGIAGFREKSAAVSQLWKALDAPAKAEWAAKAKTMAPAAKKPKPPLTGWKLFVKENYAKVEHLEFKQRLPELRRMFAASKQ